MNNLDATIIKLLDGMIEMLFDLREEESNNQKIEAKINELIAVREKYRQVIIDAYVVVLGEKDRAFAEKLVDREIPPMQPIGELKL